MVGGLIGILLAGMFAYKSARWAERIASGASPGIATMASAATGRLSSGARAAGGRLGSAAMPAEGLDRS